ncbi:LacI family DNA-binding transcriptional regulator [Vibrio parahaemolyticus]
MATIKDVAKEAGVSVATVSRVINKSPKASQSSVESVTKAMSKLGYRPNAAARALVSQSTNTMGVLVSDVSDPFFGTLVKSVDNVARENGKHILIGNGYHNPEDERQALELLINSRCDAIVIHSKGLSDEELIGYAQEVKGMVLINRHIPELAERCISLDNRKGAFLGIDVPSKVSMVGFDDGLIARFVHPSLTTIRYPIEMMAERAARLALALSRDEKVEDETIIFSPTLVRRNSVERC